MPRIRVSLSALAVLALTAVAFLLRLTNMDDVLTPKGVVFVEFDPYYHMWRIFQTLHDYPWVPLFDPAINTPQGAPVIWPPLFDLLLATVSFVLGLGRDPEKVETVSAFVIPILGALTVVALYALGRAIFDRIRALMACAVLATLPVHIWYSRLGFVDHHVAVTLVQVLLLLSLLRALASAESGAAPPRTRWLWTAAVASSLTAGFLIWNGFLLFAFLLDLCLLALLFLERDDPRSPLWRMALVTHAAAALLITPFVMATVRVTGRAFSPLTLSWLPVASLLAFAVLAGLEGLRRSRLAASWPPAARWSLLLAPVAGLAAILVHQSRNLAQGFQWLTASDRFMASVAESGSSLFTNGDFNLQQPQIWLTRFYLAVPAILVLLGLDLGRRGWRDRGRTILLIWATVLFVMSIVQRRFGEPFAPILALLVADVLMRLHDWVVRSLRPAAEAGAEPHAPTPAEARTEPDETSPTIAAPKPAEDWSPEGTARAAWLVVAVALAVGYFPSVPGFFQALRTDGKYSRETHEDFARFAALLDGRFGSTARGVPRKTGVLGPWDMGHRILYLTGSPVVADNFGLHIGEDSFREPAAFYLETDEGRAVSALERRKVSFVVTDWTLNIAEQLVDHLGGDRKEFFAPLPGPEPGTMMTPAFAQTLYFRMGSSHAGSQGVASYPGEVKVPIVPLEQFRLVHETSAAEPTRGLRIYERVPGARIQVTGAPGALLRLSYAFRTPQGKEHLHRREVAIVGGRAEIRVPYSSERPEYGHTARWMIQAQDGITAGVLVSEASVLEGRAVPLTWRPPDQRR